MNIIFLCRWLLVPAALFGLAACASSPLKGSVEGPASYDLKMELTTGGFQRFYRVHIPTGYDEKNPLPLVVVIHGAFDNAKGMERFSGFSQLADREGFIVLYPNGIGILGFLQHWNAGHCCGKAAADNIDDVGYLEAAIKDVAAQLAVDRQRVYMVGFSNGGMLVHRFAAEKGNLLAAAAPLAASIGGRPARDIPEWRIPDPVRPLPLMMVHGQADDDIPYGGGRSAHRGGERTYWSVNESVRFWVKTNGCFGLPSERSHAQGGISIKTWKTCRDRATVSLVTIAKWGHVWPGPYFTADLPVDDPLYNFDAAEMIWQFFEQYAAGL